MKKCYKIGIERDIFATNGGSGNPSENFIGITLKFLWNFSGIILGNFSEIPLIFHWNFFGHPKKFQ